VQKAQKAVVQIDINTGNEIETFRCIGDANKKLKERSSGHINEVCNGKRQTAYGYKWKWVTT